MMPTSSKLTAPLLLTLGCLVSLPGCDKIEELTGSSDETNEESDKTADAQSEDAEAKTDSKEEPIDPKEAEIAALKAELEAAKEREEAAREIDPEAADQLDQPVTPEDEVAPEQALAEGEKGPVSVANVTIKEQRLFSGNGNGLALGLDATVNESKDGGLYAKASCAVADEVFVNVATVSHSPHGELAKIGEGETKNLSSVLFFNGLPAEADRCQLAFDFGAPTFSTRLADFCWDGSSVTEGECAEPIKAEPKGDGAIVPFAFALKTRDSIARDVEGATAVDVAFGVRINEELDAAPHLYLKTACKVGVKTWVEVSPDFPHAKPFGFDKGEAVRLWHNQFFMNPLPDKPEACNIEVYRSGGFGKEDEKLTEVCWNGTQVSDGTCDFRPPPVEPAPLAADSITVDEVTHEWKEDWRDKDKVVLNLQVSATVQKPVADRTMLKASTTCGKDEDGERFVGPDLEFLGAGESVGVRMAVFRESPLQKPAKRCEVTFVAAPVIGVSPEKVEVGKFCLKGDAFSPGKCRGGGKGKGKGSDKGSDKGKGKGKGKDKGKDEPKPRPRPRPRGR